MGQDGKGGGRSNENWFLKKMIWRHRDRDQVF